MTQRYRIHYSCGNCGLASHRDIEDPEQTLRACFAPDTGVDTHHCTLCNRYTATIVKLDELAAPMIPANGAALAGRL